METTEQKTEMPKALPPGTAFTINFTIDRNGTKATFHVREIDPATYKGMKAFIAQGKQLEATEFVAKELWVGGDPVSVLKDNVVALLSVEGPLAALFAPLESTLKKN
jgi:hypothetical protein